MSIDALFVQLFQASEKCPSLSQLVIEIGILNYYMPFKGKADHHVQLQQTDTSTPDESAVKALNNISRLYYGLRCTLVHGKNKRTLKHSLKDFPESSHDFPLPTACKNDKDIAKYYIRLYKWIRDYGREVWVNYLTLLYITRFYKTAAYSLMLAVAKFLYDNYFSKAEHLTADKKKIWGYDPMRCKTEVPMQSFR